MNTPLFLLRCVEMGIPISDLHLLSIGMVMDMATERANDSYDYPMVATQDDFDSF